MSVDGTGTALPHLPAISVWNRQRKIKLDLAWLRKKLVAALPLCLARPGTHISVLPDLAEVEVALVSDQSIARVHQQFMAVPGATDVITFQHGELVVSAATAARESGLRGETVERETFRYIVHGLLHLNGHDDAEAEESAAMWQAQEDVVRQIWPI